MYVTLSDSFYCNKTTPSVSVKQSSGSTACSVRRGRSLGGAPNRSAFDGRQKLPPPAMDALPAAAGKTECRQDLVQVQRFIGASALARDSQGWLPVRTSRSKG